MKSWNAIASTRLTWPGRKKFALEDGVKRVEARHEGEEGAEDGEADRPRARVGMQPYVHKERRQEEQCRFLRQNCGGETGAASGERRESPSGRGREDERSEEPGDGDVVQQHHALVMDRQRRE